MSEYDEQAAAFLQETGASLKIELPTAEEAKSPLWQKPGDKPMQQYRVTLSKGNSAYTFDFWDSIANTEVANALDYLKAEKYIASWQTPEQYRALDTVVKHFNSRGHKLSRHMSPFALQKKYEELHEALKPSAYDILACLDTFEGDSFEDFCAEYGYDTDSRTAEATYKLVIEQDRQLRRLFTTDQLEKLQEIA